MSESEVDIGEELEEVMTTEEFFNNLIVHFNNNTSVSSETLADKVNETIDDFENQIELFGKRILIKTKDENKKGFYLKVFEIKNSSIRDLFIKRSSDTPLYSPKKLHLWFFKLDDVLVIMPETAREIVWELFDNKEALKSGIGDKKILIINDYAGVVYNNSAGKIASILYSINLFNELCGGSDDIKKFIESKADDINEGLITEISCNANYIYGGSSPFMDEPVKDLIYEFKFVYSQLLSSSTPNFSTSAKSGHPIDTFIVGPGNYEQFIDLGTIDRSALMSTCSFINGIRHVTRVYKNTFLGTCIGFEIENCRVVIIENNLNIKSLADTFAMFLSRFSKEVKYQDIVDYDYSAYKNAMGKIGEKITNIAKEASKFTIIQKKSEYENFCKQLDDIMAKLTNAKCNMKRLSYEMELLEKGEVDEDFIHSRVKLLDTHDKIKYVNVNQIENSNSTYDFDIIAFTNNIYAKVDGYWYDIGTFYIVIKVRDAGSSGMSYSLRMYNTKHLMKGYWGYCHAPHVDTRGVPCEGDLTVSISDALSAMDIASAIIICVNFLSSVNTRDAAGKYYERWPLVPEEEVKMRQNPGLDQNLAGADDLTKHVNALRKAFRNKAQA